VAACRAAISPDVTLFVGGGIRTPAEAAAARKAGADFVVIGTAVEEGSDDGWRAQIESFVRAVTG
ncbi:MAG TPA: geranylgeranylglyceryl/heptaprenylglyceryl phosphate synthase, partial [Gemmatimonadales bacterium]|nr:geranylgeranylglyceryl/heptaprenylglyceryl phosphate synthase [Gemmatimonadales bacterium]